MPGVLVFAFCVFLSFCVGVCGFLRRLVDCGYLGFVFCVGVPRAVARASACFFPRRRPAPRSCTTFYKLDVRFTYLTHRNS